MFRVENNTHDREPIMLTRIHIVGPHGTLPAQWAAISGDNLVGVLKTTFVSALVSVMPRWPR